MGLFHSQLGLLRNNSVILRSQEFGSLVCLSGSTNPSIGQWLAPNGEDLNQEGMHPFQVNVGGGDNPGYVSISLTSVENITGGLWQGIYSCVIPDERGMTQILYIGVHTTTGMLVCLSGLAGSRYVTNLYIHIHTL